MSHGPWAIPMVFSWSPPKSGVLLGYLGGPMVSSINRKPLEPKTTLSVSAMWDSMWTFHPLHWPGAVISNYFNVNA